MAGFLITLDGTLTYSMFPSRLFARIVLKNREVYLLKIITLAVAFASTTLIVAFALNEFGYDRFHAHAEDVFRVLQRNEDKEFTSNRLSSKVPPAVYHSLSHFKDSIAVARVKVMNSVSVISKDSLHINQKIHAVDSTIFSIFSFQVVDGSLKDFKGDHPVVLSEKKSIQYFGTVQSAGNILKIFTLGDTLECRVAAVFRDFPSNSHDEFNVLLRFTSKSISSLHFSESDVNLYGRMLGGTRSVHEARLNIAQHSQNVTYVFQPVSEIYFGPRVIGEEARHGDAYSIWIVLCMTGLILFLALTSFINLTTLALPYRAKELAVKKLSGISQRMIVLNFVQEGIVLVSVSFTLGVLLLVSFNSFIESALLVNIGQLLWAGDHQIIPIIVLLIGLSSIAPLLVAIKFIRATPTRLLSTDAISYPRFKKVISVLQLGTCIFLIVASVVIKRQVNYSLTKEPGRNHYQIVYLNYPAQYSNESLWELRNHWKRINPNIEDVMAISQLPNYVQSKELGSDLYLMTVDRGFFDFFDLQILKGRWFRANDEPPHVVVNKATGLPVGQEVIGILENLSEQFNQPQKPIKYNVSNFPDYNFLCIRILEVNIQKTVNYLSTYFTPNSPADVEFIDKRFEQWLHYQDRLNKLSELLAVVSGILACLAIYGLSLSLVRDKLKQIAIHKLYGASILTVTKLLAREFAQQMVIALLIFGPITYILLREFLRNFVYATPFHWTDPFIPLSYCTVVIGALCGFQASSLNRSDLTGALKGL